MQTLKEENGTQITLSALRFLSIRLHSREETKALVGGVKEQSEILENKHRAHEGAKEKRMAVSAEIQYRDGVIDRGMASLSRKALVETNNDRKDPFYRRLFPSRLSSEMKSVGGDEQVQFVDVVLEQLETLKEYEGFQSEKEELQSAQKELKATIKQREECYKQEAQERIELSIALSNAKRVYNRMYFQLQLLFDEKSLVESFFRQLRNSRTKTTTANEEGFGGWDDPAIG